MNRTQHIIKVHTQRQRVVFFCPKLYFFTFIIHHLRINVQSEFFNVFVICFVLFLLRSFNYNIPLINNLLGFDSTLTHITFAQPVLNKLDMIKHSS